MPQYLRAYRQELEQDSGPLSFVASTPGIKRDGKDLDPGRWMLDNYRKNPVVLWAHDYRGQRPPIGWGRVEIQPGQLAVSITFDQDDSFAREIERKYRNGFLNAVSVGWDDKQLEDGPAYELLDISAVPVPGDPDALMERSETGLRALLDWYKETPEEYDRGPALADLPPHSGSGAETDNTTNTVDVMGGRFTIDVDQGVDTHSVAAGTYGVSKELANELISTADMWGNVRAETIRAMAEKTDAEIMGDHRGAIPPHSTAKADEGTAWDASAQVKQIEGRAKLRMMHAWVKSEADQESKSSYKLPHHQASGQVVWRGVAAAMSRLLQAGTQIPDGDRRGVYGHLARHYGQFDKETPEFRTVAELEAYGPDEIRGQFLEDEPELWPGLFRLGPIPMVLKVDGLELVRQVATMLQGILDEAEPETEPESSVEPPHVSLETLREIRDRLQEVTK